MTTWNHHSSLIYVHENETWHLNYLNIKQSVSNLTISRIRCLKSSILEKILVLNLKTEMKFKKII